MVEDRRAFDFTGDWSITARDSGTSYNAVRQTGCRLWPLGGGRGEYARKSAKEGRGGRGGQDEVVSCVTVESLRYFRAVLIGPT